MDQDYKRNKVTVCAHLQHIFNSFIVKEGRPGPGADNFFNLEKLISKFSHDSSLSGITKDDKLSSGLVHMKRQQTQPFIDLSNDPKGKDKKECEIPNNNSILLTKSVST